MHEEYRAQAELCARAAAMASTSDIRLQYLELASAWRNLARFADIHAQAMQGAAPGEQGDLPAG